MIVSKCLHLAVEYHSKVCVTSSHAKYSKGFFSFIKAKDLKYDTLSIYIRGVFLKSLMLLVVRYWVLQKTHFNTLAYYIYIYISIVIIKYLPIQFGKNICVHIFISSRLYVISPTKMFYILPVVVIVWCHIRRVEQLFSSRHVNLLGWKKLITLNY